MGESNLIGQHIQGYKIVEKLGSGGFGTVYLGEKEDLGKKYQTAIKHISIPDSEVYETVLQDYGYDKTATLAHFEKLVGGITSEINTLLDLSKKDNRYVVAYYDHDIQKSLDPLHFDIFLRMEYLTPLNTHIRQKGITMGEVIKIGLNMCDALALCHNNGIMHRDIKEANIFVNENNNFKLGDFGVAKVAFESTQARSIKGTASYMAPEIYLHQSYDTSVDIYSLGIVLYKLLNNQRLPFMPDAPAQFTADDKNNAETRRLKGDVPPLPANAKNRLGEIVIKACSEKGSRYQKAEEFKDDLSAFLSTLTVVDYDQVVVAQSSDGSERGSAYQQNSVESYTQTQGATMTMGAQNGTAKIPPATINPYGEKPNKKRTLMIASILSFLVIAVLLTGFFLLSKSKDPVNQLQAAVEKTDFIEQVTVIISNAENFASKGAYESAIGVIEAGLISYPDSKELKGKREEYTLAQEAKNQILLSAKTFKEAGDYPSAIYLIKDAVNRNNLDENFQNVYRTYFSEYKITSVLQADSLAAGGEYTSAISKLEGVKGVIGDDADLNAKIQEYTTEKKEYDAYVLKQEVKAAIEEAAPPPASPIVSQGTSRAITSPFYGIWCEASKIQSEAQAAANEMINQGIDAQVIVTTDWSNLNSEKYYVVAAGVYSSNADADSALSSVQKVYSGAYVKYSGDYQGTGVSSYPQSSTQSVSNSRHSPFYGIWCGSSKIQSEAQEAVNEMIKQGFDAKLIVTTDWSDLNNQKYYVAAAGVYSSEAEANSALASVQKVYSEAYVEYFANKLAPGFSSYPQSSILSAGNSSPPPFYGIWCDASKIQSEAQEAANQMRKKGFDAQVFLTTDWSNLSNIKWYAVSAGVYRSESEAEAALDSVQKVYPDPYVKYSGSYQSNN